MEEHHRVNLLYCYYMWLTDDDLAEWWSPSCEVVVAVVLHYYLDRKALPLRMSFPRQSDTDPVEHQDHQSEQSVSKM